MRFRIGTSGFGYKEWKGKFYPADLKAAQMLPYYAERFATVELNNTFYRMPSVETVRSWAAEVPDDFKFAVKISRRVSHDKRLKDVSDPLAYFLTVVGELGAKRGPTLVQLPPFLKKDTERLAAFLTETKDKGRFTFEFRHQTWFDDEVYALLKQHGAALCVADSEDLTTPIVATADWGYARLRRLDYTDADLERWARDLTGQRWGEAYVYFKHEDTGAGPVFGQKFSALVSSPTVS